MTTVREIYNTLFAFAPASMKMDWDNVGLLCGRFDAPVDTVLVALDPMPDVIAEAKETGAQCIVTHHPLFFDAPNAINDDSYAGRCLLELAEAKIAAINLHTNLDVCPGGVNDTLMRVMGAENVRGEGFCKLVYDVTADRLLGVQMVGSYASEIIYGAGMMVQLALPLEQLKKIVFPHPSVCEVLREGLFML